MSQMRNESGSGKAGWQADGAPGLREPGRLRWRAHGDREWTGYRRSGDLPRVRVSERGRPGGTDRVGDQRPEGAPRALQRSALHAWHDSPAVPAKRLVSNG